MAEVGYHPMWEALGMDLTTRIQAFLEMPTARR